MGPRFVAIEDRYIPLPGLNGSARAIIRPRNAWRYRQHGHGT
jgi:hypothetical protein